MAGLKDISTIWKNIKEIDLKPIRESATHPVRIALASELASGRHTLAEQMRTDPARPDVHTQSAIAFTPLDPSTDAPPADLIIVILDATRQDFSTEQSLVKKWSDGGKNVLVLVNKIDLLEKDADINSQLGWQASQVLFGSVNDIAFLQREFVPAVLELLPQQHLALGRLFPLFRLTIARQIINDTCFSNAAYSFSTGLAEIVPVLDLPLNLTDMIVLTKSQAFLAYRLGLLLGFSTSWQDYVTEFGSVIGSGFLWRQIARQLIGLIPAWGIIPKVGVAYSGTYVVGNAILGWYLTGRHLSPKQMRALSVQAFTRGKEVARRLGERFPRPKFGRRKKKELAAPRLNPELTQGDAPSSSGNAGNQVIPSPLPGGLIPNAPERVEIAHQVAPRRSTQGIRRHISLRKKRKIAKQPDSCICQVCGKTSGAQAVFCQYCGNKFEQ
ncbi:MAG: hypothetical protein A2136_01380 [Chloroflexi bacterium RBG_16_54_11]|nr:MAG: hypothetical protein A2136_01380 [Chloroflexi bacterium RBG_16_54_11]